MPCSKDEWVELDSSRQADHDRAVSRVADLERAARRIAMFASHDHDCTSTRYLSVSACSCGYTAARWALEDALGERK